VRSLDDIRNRLVDHKNRLFRDYPIKSLAFFGSFARGDQNDISDLDILVEFSDKIGIRFVDLADELESIVGFKVDLISKKGIKEKYLKAIDQDLIYV
jgi:predicted nucleotidyltransferase